MAAGSVKQVSLLRYQHQSRSTWLQVRFSASEEVRLFGGAASGGGKQRGTLDRLNPAGRQESIPIVILTGHVESERRCAAATGKPRPIPPIVLCSAGRHLVGENRSS